jgi:hypothetical protein
MLGSVAGGYVIVFEVFPSLKKGWCCWFMFLVIWLLWRVVDPPLCQIPPMSVD